MKTVKQVSDLTGISVRSLHYYDEIGLLKPSEMTEAGYRLYDDEALKTLQQILFFKELDIPLKDVKDIMGSPYFDKMEALKNQKKLLLVKRKRLDDLINLINKTLKGEGEMSFKEFDMSEYYKVLEDFKIENEDKVIKMYGSLEKYNESIEKIKTKEDEIAKMAIKEHGSIEKFAEAIKKNFDSDMFIISEQIDKFKKDCLEGKHLRLKELFGKITKDLNEDPTSKEIQEIAGEITTIAKKDYEVFSTEIGDDLWYSNVQLYLVYPEWIESIDEKYGSGAAKLIGEALKFYLEDKLPKSVKLYKNLTADLSKDPSSREIQQIVEEIASETKKSSDFLKMDMGENYWGYRAEQYISNPIYEKAMDKKYGSGAAKFMGEAFKVYAKNK
ncbi:MerR family transcriptional regulator [Clostridium sp. YIM B02505]|uniref:MerR family transcriptional regulator n=1 Tax=Clostridium yunnanense TaxID=2800325 RepID=A0ABS1ETR4_9CLOT|nr:MerR family transcriptional regulator [Clostridium yunnanense]MBK1812776.1 MerR family transcriptional regulator [Clostridium yunnanense]